MLTCGINQFTKDRTLKKEKQVIEENKILDNDKKETPPENEGIKVSSLSDISGGLIDEMPEVQPHAVQAHLDNEKQKESNEKPTQNNSQSDNVKFNPELHVVDENGNPVKTKTGKFRLKPGMAKKAKLLNDPDAPDPQNQISEETKMVAAMIEDIAAAGYNHYLDYDTPEMEKIALTEIDYKFLMSKGGANMSPGLMLAIGQGQRLAKAMTTEKGKKKAGGLKKWVYTKWIQFKERKKVKDGTHTSTRSDDVGENDGGSKDIKES